MNDFKVYKKYFNTLSIPSEHFSMHLRGHEVTVEPNTLIPPERLEPRLHSAFLSSAFCLFSRFESGISPRPDFCPRMLTLQSGVVAGWVQHVCLLVPHGVI